MGTLGESKDEDEGKGEVEDEDKGKVEDKDVEKVKTTVRECFNSIRERQHDKQILSEKNSSGRLWWAALYGSSKAMP